MASYLLLPKNNSSFTPDNRLKSAVINYSVNRDRCGSSDTRAVSPRDRERRQDRGAPTDVAGESV